MTTHTIEHLPIASLGIDALSLSQARRAAARAKLKHETEALERAQVVVRHCQEAVARLAGNANLANTAVAHQLAEQLRGGGPTNFTATDQALHERQRQVAETTLTIAAKAAAEIEATHAAAQAALNAAEAAAHRAALAFVHAEIRAEFETYEALRKQFEAKRERLLGAYLAHRAALTDIEWESLDFRLPARSEVLQIGLPPVGRSVFDPEAFGPEPHIPRQRVDAAQAAWQRRLAELEADA